MREIARALRERGLRPRNRVKVTADVDGAAIGGIEGDVGVLDDRVLVEGFKLADVAGIPTTKRFSVVKWNTAADRDAVQTPVIVKQ